MFVLLLVAAFLYVRYCRQYSSGEKVEEEIEEEKQEQQQSQAFVAVDIGSQK